MIIDVIIENPLKESVKYEWDEAYNMPRGDRLMTTSMTYPGNYGFIPKTTAGDGDPIDVLLPIDQKLRLATIHSCRVIGALITRDEACAGPDVFDEKILAIPTYCKKLNHIKNYTDLDKTQQDMIKHFFEHYKDNEEHKWVEVQHFVDANAAAKLITDYRKSADNELSEADTINNENQHWQY